MLSTCTKGLKQVHPDIEGIMNSTTSSSASPVNRLISLTITSREMQTAVCLLLSGELTKHTVSEETKTVTKHTPSKAHLI